MVIVIERLIFESGRRESQVGFELEISLLNKAPCSVFKPQYDHEGTSNFDEVSLKKLFSSIFRSLDLL